MTAHRRIRAHLLLGGALLAIAATPVLAQTAPQPQTATAEPTPADGNARPRRHRRHRDEGFDQPAENPDLDQRT